MGHMIQPVTVKEKVCAGAYSDKVYEDRWCRKVCGKNSPDFQEVSG